MFITVYTDASAFENKYAWAFAAKSNSGSLCRYGKCPEYVTKIGEAEFFAFIAAAHLIREAWPETERILLCSDSSSAIHWVKDHPKNSIPKQLRQHWRTASKGVLIFTKKVKAHSGKLTIEVRMNRLVDRYAQKARETIK